VIRPGGALRWSGCVRSLDRQNMDRCSHLGGLRWTQSAEDPSGHRVERANEPLVGQMTLDGANRTLQSSVEEGWCTDKIPEPERRHETLCTEKDTAHSHHSSAPGFSSLYILFGD
jgi:hypothetical protein